MGRSFATSLLTIERLNMYIRLDSRAALRCTARAGRLRKALTLVAVGGVLIGALAACGATAGPTATAAPTGESGQTDPLAALYEEAKSEGTLTYYSTIVTENLDQMKAAFESAYPGVTLNFLRLGGAEGPIRFTAERGAGATSADVMTSSEQGFSEDALEKGWIVDLADAGIPTLSDYPKDFVDGPEAIIQVSPIRLTVNTDLVDDPPSSWEDLLEPEYAGKLILVDPRAIMPYMAQYSLLLDTFGEEFLEGIAENGYRLADSTPPAAQSLAAGEAMALFPSLDSVANPLIAQGAPIETIKLDPFIGAENWVVLNSEAEHPAAARLFVSWMLTPEGQAAINSDFGASPLPDIPDTAELGDGYASWEKADVEANRDAVLKALGIQ